MQPHRAEYILRLGSAANAPRVGTATQDLTLGCEAWHLEREVRGDIPVSAALKFTIASTLVSDESRSGDDLRYLGLQVQNGAAREVRGKVQRTGEKLGAEIFSAGGSAVVPLPDFTRMPVASIGHVVDTLRAGSVSFSTLSFDAQGSGEAFRIDVAIIEDAAIRRRPPSEEPLSVPGASWPLRMRFVRAAEDQSKPILVLTGRLYESGIFDRVTVDADVVTVTADLRKLELRPVPDCPDAGR